MNILGGFFDYVGGFIRYLYGSSIRYFLLPNRRSYSLKEYIHGADETGDPMWDRVGHSIINRLIGTIIILILISFLTRF
jgi:hypothetical protein